MVWTKSNGKTPSYALGVSKMKMLEVFTVEGNHACILGMWCPAKRARIPAGLQMFMFRPDLILQESAYNGPAAIGNRAGSRTQHRTVRCRTNLTVLYRT